MQRPSPRSAFVAALIATSTMALAASAAPAEAAEREASRAAVATAGGQIGPIVVYPVKHDLSPPLREIARTLKPAPAEAGEREVEEQILNFWAPIISPAVPDPVVQDWYGDGTIPGPEFSFEGNRNSENAGAVSPPDTNGDIGPNHYLHSVNLIFSVYNRAGARLLGPLPTNAVFAGFGGPCQTTNSGDPIALYDHMADRWLLSQFTPPSQTPFHQCIAISQTGDPTGSWHRYDFVLPSTVFNDYPKFGVWPDAYYMSASGRGIPGPPTDIYAFERAQMLTGGTARLVFFRTDSSLGYVTPMPADLDGTTLPPAGAPNPFVGVKQSIPQALYVFRFHVDWTNTANSTFGLNGLPNETLTSIAPFTLICPTTRDCIRQPPPATIGLDALAGRYVMYRAQYRNFGTHESIVFNHTVDAGATRAGVRWYEIRDPNGTPVIHQQGTYAPADGINRWMGSAAMDKFGNLAIGYSVSSTTVFPGIRYAGRLATDPLGELTQGEAELIAGAGVQTSTGSRWGDYSMMAVDPTDDCTFWYTTEYYQTTSSTGWQTRIGRFRFPNCVTTDFTVSANPSTVTVPAGGSGTTSVTVQSINGFSSLVNLSCNAVGFAVKCSFNPGGVTPPANGSASTTLTLNTQPALRPGPHQVIVNAESGGVVRSTTVTVVRSPNLVP